MHEPELATLPEIPASLADPLESGIISPCGGGSRATATGRNFKTPYGLVPAQLLRALTLSSANFSEHGVARVACSPTNRLLIRACSTRMNWRLLMGLENELSYRKTDARLCHLRGDKIHVRWKTALRVVNEKPRGHTAGVLLSSYNVSRAPERRGGCGTR